MENDTEAGILESADIVMASYPNAFCRSQHDLSGEWFFIMTGDKDTDKPLAMAYENREKAWNKAAKHILNTLLKKLSY